MSNCSSLNIPSLPKNVRVIHDQHSSLPVPSYTKDGILYVDIKEARTVVKLYNDFFHKLREFDKASAKPSSRSSAGRRQKRRRKEFVDMVLSLPEVRKMPNTHTFRFSDDKIYELYLKYKLRPQVNRADLPWALEPHDSVMDLSYDFYKNSQRHSPPRDAYLEDALNHNKFFDKHRQLHKTDQGYMNSMLHAKNHWWQNYFNQTVKERPVPYINYRNLRLAKQMLEQELAAYEFEAMSFWDVIQSDAFLKIKDHSTGLTAPGFPNKLEACQNKSFQNYVKNFMSSLNAYGTFSLFFKNEAIKREKVQSRGPRVIVASTLEHEMLQRCVLQHFIENVMLRRHNNPIKIGLKNTEFGNLFDYHTRNGEEYFYCADFTAQDKYMPRQFMTSGIDAMINVARRQLGPEFASYLEHALKSGIDKVVQYPNGQLVQYDALFPTGQLDTANGNSRNHSLLWYYTLLQSGLSVQQINETTRSQYGDDVLLSDKGLLRTYQERIIQVSTDLGMPMTFDAWGEKAFYPDGSSNPNVTFLKRSFCHFGDHIIPTYDAERIIQKYLTPTQSYDRHHRSVEESIDRQFSFALLAGGNKKLYNQIMQNINYLADKYNVRRDYLTLAYSDMIDQFYTGTSQMDPRLAPYNPNKDWELPLGTEQNSTVSDVNKRILNKPSDYFNDTFFPSRPRKSGHKNSSSTLPSIKSLSAPADCWLRNIVSFEPKPVVKAVISTLLKDGYNLEALRNYGLPHDTARQIIPLLSKPVYDHMDKDYNPRSSKPTEIGHHIYANHATWVTPDGVFHENSSTEVHQIEALYPDIEMTLEKSTRIAGILDLLKNAHDHKRISDPTFIPNTVIEDSQKFIETLSTEDLMNIATSDDPISVQRKSRNIRKRQKWRLKRSWQRLTNFFSKTERVQEVNLGKSHGKLLATHLNSQLLQAEPDELLRLVQCNADKFQHSSYGKFVDDEPLDHSDLGIYDPSKFDASPLEPIHLNSIPYRDEFAYLYECGQTLNVWINYNTMNLQYFVVPTYGHIEHPDPQHMIRITDLYIKDHDTDISLIDPDAPTFKTWDDISIRQRWFYLCAKCDIVIEETFQLATDHAKVCQSTIGLVSPLRSKANKGSTPMILFDGISGKSVCLKESYWTASCRTAIFGVMDEHIHAREMIRQGMIEGLHTRSIHEYKSSNIFQIHHLRKIKPRDKIKTHRSFFLPPRPEPNLSEQDSELFISRRLRSKTRSSEQSLITERINPNQHLDMIGFPEAIKLKIVTWAAREYRQYHGRSIAVNSVINAAWSDFNVYFNNSPAVEKIIKDSELIPIHYHILGEY
jgi:hypothetical protein